MSYIVSIKREGAAIQQAELEAAISDIAGFARDGALIIWQPPQADAKPSVFMLDDSGAIRVTTPSNATLRTMQTVARRLNARVVGEEGEDLSDVSAPDGKTSPAGCIAALAVLAIAGCVVWWLFA